MLKEHSGSRSGQAGALQGAGTDSTRPAGTASSMVTPPQQTGPTAAGMQANRQVERASCWTWSVTSGVSTLLALRGEEGDAPAHWRGGTAARSWAPKRAFVLPLPRRDMTGELRVERGAYSARCGLYQGVCSTWAEPMAGVSGAHNLTCALPAVPASDTTPGVHRGLSADRCNVQLQIAMTRNRQTLRACICRAQRSKCRGRRERELTLGSPAYLRTSPVCHSAGWSRHGAQSVTRLGNLAHRGPVHRTTQDRCDQSATLAWESQAVPPNMDLSMSAPSRAHTCMFRTWAHRSWLLKTQSALSLVGTGWTAFRTCPDDAPRPREGAAYARSHARLVTFRQLIHGQTAHGTTFQRKHILTPCSA